MGIEIELIAFTLVPSGVLVSVIVYSIVKIYELRDVRLFLLVLLLVLMTFHQTTEILQYAGGDFYATTSVAAEAYESGANLLASAASYLVIQQIDELRTTRSELERSNAALRERSSMVSVLNRVLRHNVRNDINVIAGRAKHVQERTDDEQIQGELATIEETAWELATISDRTQRIRQLLTEDSKGTTTLRLIDGLEASLERVRSETDAIIRLENAGDSEAVVDSASTLATAIADVVERIVIANDGSVHVDITVIPASTQADSDCESTVIRIDDDGEGLPELDIRAIENETETPLKHAEGLELWCLEWTVKRSDGELDTDPGDATVEIRLPGRSGPD